MMKRLGMIIVDAIFIIGSVYFLSLPFGQNQTVNKIEKIKTELNEQQLLTPRVEEYLTKASQLYNTKSNKIGTMTIHELNSQYPVEVTTVINNYFQK